MNNDEKNRQELIKELQRLRQRVSELQESEEERKQAEEALRRQNEYLNALQETALGLIGRLDLADLLEAIITRAGALMGTEHGYVYLLEPGEAEMKLQVGIGAQSEAIGHRLKPGEGISGRVWQTGQPLIVEDYKNWPGRPPEFERSIVQSAVGVPLKSGGRTVSESKVIGAIGLTYLEESAARRPRTFGENEIQALSRFAELASVALDNARLYTAAQQELAERKAAQAEQQRLLHELEARSLQLHTAAEVARYATSILDPGQLLPQVVELIRDSFNLYYVGIFLLDRTERQVVLRAGTGEAGRKMIEASHKFELGSGMIGWCVANSQARIALDVGLDAVRFDNPLLPETRSELALPLISHGQVIGAMTVQSDREAAFSQEHITTLQTMADQVANAIENARLFQETQLRVTELSILNEIGQAFSSALDLDQLLEIVYQQVSHVFDTTNFFIATYKEGDDELNIPFRTEHDQRQPPLQLRLGEGLTSHILRTHQPLLLNSQQEILDFLSERKVAQVGELAKSWMGVPLIAADRAVGVMAIQSYEEENLYSEQGMALFSTIASQAAIAIQNARLFEETQRRTEEMAILNHITETISRSLELESLLEATLETVLMAANFDASLISLYDEHAGRLYLASQQGLPELLAQRFEQQGLGGTLCEYVFQTGQTLSLRDVEQGAPVSAGRIADVSGLIKHGLYTYVGVPLAYKGRLQGTICLFNRQAHELSADKLSLLEAIGLEISIGIENARLFTQAQQRAAQLEWLALIESTLSQVTNEEEILTAITLSIELDQLPSYVSLQYVETDVRGQPAELCTTAVWYDGIIQPDAPGLHQHSVVKDLPTAKLWLDEPGRTLLIPDVQADPHADAQLREYAAQESFQAIALMPLHSGGRWHGLVTFLWQEPHTFSPDERFYLHQLLEPAAATVATRRAYLAQEEARRESEHRAMQLQMAAEVSHVASTILDLDESVQQVVDLLCNLLRLHYAGLFLVDQTGEWTGQPGKWAVLRASASLTGHTPVRQGYKLEIGGESIIGQCIANNQPHTALYTSRQGDKEMRRQGDEETRREPPNDELLLPGTRSELVLPLSSRGQVVGAIVLQSSPQDASYEETAFHEDNIVVFQTMADQLGTAIENAWLFAQAQARAEHERLVRIITDKVRRASSTEAILQTALQELGQLVGASQSAAYLGTQAQLLDIRTQSAAVADETRRQGNKETSRQVGKWPPAMAAAMQQAVQQGETVVDSDSFGSAQDKERLGSTLAVPIRLQKEVIGIIGLSRESASVWSESEIAAIEDIVEQVALALENQRLFDEQQQARALLDTRVKELDTLNDIGRKINEAPSIPEFLEWVAEHIPQAMQYSELCVVAIEFEGQIYGAAEAVKLPFQIVGGLYVGNETVGQVYIAYKEKRDFLNEESALLGDIIRRVSGYIENRHLLEQTQTALTQTEEQARHLALLNEMSAQLSQAANIDEILKIATVKTSQILTSDRSSITLLNDAGDAFQVLALQGEEGTVPVGVTLPAEGTVMERAIRENRVIITPDSQSGDLSVRCTMVAPLIAGGRAVGTLNVGSATPNFYAEHDANLLLQIASLTASSIENRRLIQETQARARREQILREITTRVRGSTDAEAIMRTAVRELGTALGRPAFIRLGSAEETSRQTDATAPHARPKGG